MSLWLFLCHSLAPRRRAFSRGSAAAAAEEAEAAGTLAPASHSYDDHYWLNTSNRQAGSQSICACACVCLFVYVNTLATCHWIERRHTGDELCGRQRETQREQLTRERGSGRESTICQLTLVTRTTRTTMTAATAAHTTSIASSNKNNNNNGQPPLKRAPTRLTCRQG